LACRRQGITPEVPLLLEVVRVQSVDSAVDCWCSDVPAFECECGASFESFEDAKIHATKAGGRHEGHDLTNGGCTVRTAPPAKVCSKPAGHDGPHAACCEGHHPFTTWRDGR
jgi:hypothetical protein